MYVVKRDGRRMPVAFDKITARVKKLSYGLDARFCDPVSLRLVEAAVPTLFQNRGSLRRRAPRRAAPARTPERLGRPAWRSSQAILRRAGGGEWASGRGGRAQPRRLVLKGREGLSPPVAVPRSGAAGARLRALAGRRGRGPCA